MQGFRRNRRGVHAHGRVHLRVALLALAMGVARAHEPVFTVGIVPQRSALTLALTWTPLLRAVGRAAYCHLHFETARNIPTFERRVLAGRYDIAYLNPYQYVVAHRKRRYHAFLADAGHLRSILVVPRGSPVHSLRGLAHLSVAFPAPGSLAASILPQALLARYHIPIRPVYVASHGSVYRAVAAGLYAAGGGIVKTFQDFPKAIRDRLRVLWRGPPLPPHPLAVLPGLPKAVLRRLRSAFLGLAGTSQGRRLLASIGVRAFVPADNRDYDPIRARPLAALVAPR